LVSALTNFLAALQSLHEHRQRAFLSATGIMVGAAAIILLISIARGVQADVSNQVTGLGVNLLVVVPGKIDTESLFSPNLAGLSYLRDEDVDRVRRIPGVKRAAPLMFVGGGIRRGTRESSSTFVVAAGADWFGIHQSKLGFGRFFSQSDAHSRVCVIGSVAKTHLFGDEQALGKEVAINDTKYTVIGVTQDPKAEDSLFSMGGFENMAYIPYEAMKDITPNPQINRIMIQTDPGRDPKELVSTVKNVLAQRLSDQEFTVMTQRDLLNIVYRILGLLTSLLTGLTSIALVVGGMGIMTVMLMSVGERAKEIGIRKTVGATHRDIFFQFLFEALCLTIFGGLVGLGVSFLACEYLTNFTKIKPLLNGSVIVLGLLVSTVVGIIFGLLPALKAARKNPVDALRSE